MNSRNRVIKGFLFAAFAVSCGMTFGGTSYSYALPDSDIVEVDNLFPRTTSATTAFAGLNLSEWRVAGGALQGYSCARTVADGMPAYATNEHRTNGVYDVQLQGYEGEHIKCVKIRLWQDGPDVKVQAISAAYCYSVYRTNGGYKLGIDLDLDQEGPSTVATGPTAAGYGVKKIVLVKVGSEIKATDVYAEGDTVTVGDWTKVTIDAPTACAAYMPQMNVPLGAELSFADTSAESWPAGARLSVVGDLEQSFLRFGTDASGLTAGQLSCIRVNGHRAVLDENGYMHESIPGMMLIFR